MRDNITTATTAENSGENENENNEKNDRRVVGLSDLHVARVGQPVIEGGDLVSRQVPARVCEGDLHRERVVRLMAHQEHVASINHVIRLCVSADSSWGPL